MFIDRDLVQRMKEQYPPGTRIELDDMGTVHCDFDNGRRLGLVPGEDSFHVISERNRADRDAR